MAPAKTATSSRTRFSQDDYLTLLREVRAVNPLDLLLAQYRRNNRANMRKSGTEEQSTEKDQLLQDNSQFADDLCHKIRLTAARKVACARPQSSAISAAERSATSVARDAAEATHVVHLTDTTEVEEADFIC
ncbi:hypothetical protein HPB49_013615 [Dermacentor silvarum]|uniref:Uncharacterized protein n=1 Tax=Dermacentor silvarum TaxID=543639 RepID=A0ACB8DP27_DERSI|nr:hypothetical protein HPB49_013615 [Dermacentor silvarum]